MPWLDTSGTSIKPAFGFSSESSLGFYRSGVSAIGVSYGQFQFVVGTALLPGLAISSESSLGWYKSGASALGLSYGQLQLPAGTALQPSMAFSSESSLGFYRSAASNVVMSYGVLGLSALSMGGTIAGLFYNSPNIKVADADGYAALWAATAGGDSGNRYWDIGNSTAGSHIWRNATGATAIMQLYSKGTLDLKQTRLLSIKTNASNSGLNAIVMPTEFAIGVGISNATIMFRSGNTTYLWGTSSTTSS